MVSAPVHLHNEIRHLGLFGTVFVCDSTALSDTSALRVITQALIAVRTLNRRNSFNQWLQPLLLHIRPCVGGPRVNDNMSHMHFALAYIATLYFLSSCNEFYYIHIQYFKQICTHISFRFGYKTVWSDFMSSVHVIRFASCHWNNPEVYGYNLVPKAPENVAKCHLYMCLGMDYGRHWAELYHVWRHWLLTCHI